ncbi:MAG: hypothetical protein Q8K75_06560 [Chlamydiales bacterium]|nr:hypothetical protein [Chlamydiales bacterium]
MKSSLPSPLEAAILAYCVWQASDLPVSWLTAPAVKYAWIAFIIWCLPAFWHIGYCILNEKPKGSQPWLLGAAIVASLLGMLGSLNMLKHIGLALAIAGLIPFSLGVPIWVGTALAWLPGFGWMIKGLPFVVIPIIQIVIASIGTVVMFLTSRRTENEQE